MKNCPENTEYIEKSFSEIQEIDREKIAFTSGERIVFQECIGRRYNHETCVAERDISAKPPFFEFFTPEKPTRIIFDSGGFFSKSKNRDAFRKLQMMLIEFGFSSYDLS